jgi:hypothetical protein
LNYLIAVFSDRIAAEAAYTALEADGFSADQVAILGRGYKSADEFGLIDPKERAWKQIKFMATWTIPFGFVAGASFSVLSGLETFAWAGAIGNHLIGGILGGLSGAMGSFFVGGGVGLAVGGGDALPYRNRLNAGKYLVTVKSPNRSPIDRATGILRPLNPENLQGYSEQANA